MSAIAPPVQDGHPSLPVKLPAGAERVGSEAGANYADPQAVQRFLGLHETRFTETLDAAAQSVSQLVSQLRPLVASEGHGVLDGFQTEMRTTFAFLKSQLDVLVGAIDLGERQASALEVSITLELMKRDLEDLRLDLAELTLPRESSGGGPVPAVNETAAFKRLSRLLERALGHWWRLVAGMLRPKEWLLKGEVHVPFLGSAGVEIKFGPTRSPE